MNNDSSIEFRNKILESLRTYANSYSQLVFPKTKMIINYDHLPVAFETMKYGRIENVDICKDCEYHKLCQEGPYTLRISSTGKIKTCLLQNKTIDLLEAIREKSTDDKLIDLFTQGFILFNQV